MSHLPYDTTEDAVIDFVEEWVALLEAENYELAFDFTAHTAGAKWTPSLFSLISNYQLPFIRRVLRQPMASSTQSVE